MKKYRPDKTVMLSLCIGWGLFGGCQVGVWDRSAAPIARPQYVAGEQWYQTTSPAEQKLWARVSQGVCADFSSDKDRVIRGSYIEWLCSPAVSHLLTTRGIDIKGAKIEGQVILDRSVISFPITFRDSQLGDKISLLGTRVRSLHFFNTRVHSIDARWLNVEGELHLCYGFHADGPVNLFGATIGGSLGCPSGRFMEPNDISLNLAFSKVGGNVILGLGCEVKNKLLLYGADIRGGLDCGGHFVGPNFELNADSLNVGSNVDLRNMLLVDGLITLRGAKLGGDLDCTNSKVSRGGPDSVALNASGAQIGGRVFFGGSEFQGQVILHGTKVEGTLSCERATFANPGKVGFSANGLKVQGDIAMTDAKAMGTVYLLRATIDGAVICSGAKFSEPNDGIAMSLDGAQIGGTVFVNKGAEIDGSIRLVGVRVDGDVYCQDTNFVNPHGPTLNAAYAKVQGRLLLGKGSRFKGLVVLTGASVYGDLDCQGSFFSVEKANDLALVADMLAVSGNVVLRDANFVGGASLREARIGRDLDCDNGSFTTDGACSFVADWASVAGNVLMRSKFRSRGTVSIRNVTIGGHFDCSGAKFISDVNLPALDGTNLKVDGDVYLQNDLSADGTLCFRRSRIDGEFVCKDIILSEKGVLDLRFADINTIHDPGRWPKKGKWFLDGLVYKQLAGEVRKDATTRLTWLNRHGENEFDSQPYEQLASVFRKEGDSTGERIVLIEKNRAKARETKWTRETWAYWCWYHVFGPMIDYGYHPLKVVWPGLGLHLLVSVPFWLALGCVIFGIGKAKGVIIATKEAEYVGSSRDEARVSGKYPKFSFVMYSIDVFVPIIDLQQAKYWVPTRRRGSKPSLTGLVVWSYHLAHILVGRVLTTLLVLGLTGLVRT